MTQFTKILCVVDPASDTQPAMSRASWYAKRSRASIDLLVCYYNEYLSGERFFDAPSLENERREMLQIQEQSLEALAAPLRESGIEVRTNVVWDHPLDEGIIKQSIALKADVVIKDMHYHSAISRILLTNTDWNLIRSCPVPLWLAGSNIPVDKPKIIAAIDPFNEHDKPAVLDDRILTAANEVAETAGGELHAFHSFDPNFVVSGSVVDSHIPTHIPYVDIEKSMRERHGARFAELANQYGIPDTRAHLVAGLTHQELPKLASHLKASMVVMGAVSRNKLKRLFIGATAEKTLGRLPCDLMIIKHNPFETPSS